MASIRKDILIEAPAADVWAAVRDVGLVHQRLARGFVVDTRLDGDSRVVTFANGAVVRELLVDIDDESRRFAYAAVGGRAAHHHASMQVVTDGAHRSRIIWITDVMPHDAAAPIRALVEEGARVIKRTLERSAAPG
jgi:carbon monoxide dehydrogenase subunit G